MTAFQRRCQGIRELSNPSPTHRAGRTDDWESWGGRHFRESYWWPMKRSPSPNATGEEALRVPQPSHDLLAHPSRGSPLSHISAPPGGSSGPQLPAQTEASSYTQGGSSGTCTGGPLPAVCSRHPCHGPLSTRSWCWSISTVTRARALTATSVHPCGTQPLRPRHSTSRAVSSVCFLTRTSRSSRACFSRGTKCLLNAQIIRIMAFLWDSMGTRFLVSLLSVRIAFRILDLTFMVLLFAITFYSSPVSNIF